MPLQAFTQINFAADFLR